MYMYCQGQAKQLQLLVINFTIREFIREEVGISTPTASLLKAALNGAVDENTGYTQQSRRLGPNFSRQHCNASYSGTDLTTFHDNARTLSGFSALYQFDMDPSSGSVALNGAIKQVVQILTKICQSWLMIWIQEGPDGSIFEGNVIVNGFQYKRSPR